MPRFWHLTAPNYSDYHDTYINGTVSHPFTIPGIRCETCGQTWMETVRVLPIECPEAIRDIFPPDPITFSKFEEIRNAICAATGCSPRDLRPGISLLPSSMEVPSHPQADFLWGSLGSLVVSARVKNCFASAGFSGLALVPMTISKVGQRSAKLPPPIPESGEPDDIMELANRAPGSDIGQYFEAIVTADSKRVKGTEPSSVCKVCGFEQWSPPHHWAMEESLWNGTDVFFMAPTSMIFVTDRVKVRLVEIGATNVRAVQVG